MAIFAEFTENDRINKRHPLSKAIIWPTLRKYEKTVRDRM